MARSFTVSISAEMLCCWNQWRHWRCGATIGLYTMIQWHWTEPLYSSATPARSQQTRPHTAFPWCTAHCYYLTSYTR